MPPINKKIVEQMSVALALAREYLKTYKTLRSRASAATTPGEQAVLQRSADAAYDAWLEEMQRFERLRQEHEGGGQKNFDGRQGPG